MNIELQLFGGRGANSRLNGRGILSGNANKKIASKVISTLNGNDVRENLTKLGKDLHITLMTNYLENTSDNITGIESTNSATIYKYNGKPNDMTKYEAIGIVEQKDGKWKLSKKYTNARINNTSRDIRSVVTKIKD